MSRLYHNGSSPGKPHWQCGFLFGRHYLPTLSRATFTLVAVLVVAGFTSAATDIAGTITSDATWTVAGSPYRLTGNTTIASGVIVTVRPKVQVIAQGNYQLTVQGKLRCLGTRSRPVVFKSTSPTTPGSWAGVYIAAGGVGWFGGTSFWAGTNCVTVDGGWAKFERCWFLYAGQDGLYVLNDATIQVETSTFAHNQRRGLYILTPDPAGTISDCIFMNNGEYPIHVKANCVGMLGSNLRFHNNGQDLIGVSCSAANDIRRTQTWQYQPLRFDLLVGSSDLLEIPQGIRLTLESGCQLIADRIEVRGTLVSGAAGQASVVIRGVNETPGCWDGIFLHANSVGQFTSTTVRLAQTALTVDDALLVYTGGVVRDCQYDGVVAFGNSRLDIANTGFHNNGRSHLRLSTLRLSGSISGCTFTGSGDYPVYARARNCFMLGAGNYYSGNTRQAVGVACDHDPDLPSSQTWYSQGVPYDLTADVGGTLLRVASGATWTLQPGVIIAGGSVDIEGELNTLGTALEPVVFTTAVQPATNGSWDGIYFHPAARGTLKHCLIKHAETGVLIQSASPRLENCIITDCADYGLFVSGTAQPTIYRSQITGNDGEGVRITGQARPNLGNLYTSGTDDDGYNSFTSNAACDIHNESPHNIRAQNNWWGTDAQGVIAARIIDGDDNPGAGLVFFRPIIPVQSNAAPVLAWSGLAGSRHDGVSPDAVDPYQYVDFRVKYQDSDGDAPAYMRLHLLKGGTEYEGSPYNLVVLPGQAGDYTAGVIYHLGLRLPAGDDYSYYFAASDGFREAGGEPTNAHPGPTVGTGGAGVLISSVTAQQAPAGNVEIRCRMLATGWVDIEVLNIAGRPVARIATGRELNSGENILLWNACSARGTKVPTGRYLIRVAATSDIGVRQQVLTPLLLRR